jgi:GTPase SAR1 family protein
MYEENFDKMYQHIFGKEKREPHKNPKFSYVFASPGAGKTSLMKQFLDKEYPNGEKPIILEIDEMKYFIPADLNKDERMKIADKWYHKLIDMAITERQSFISLNIREMVYINRALNTYKKAKDNGYVTEANFLAVNKKKSRLGIISRYEKALKNMIYGKNNCKNYPRKPKFFNHYIFYKAAPIMTAVCSNSNNVDIVRVFDRDGNLLSIYKNTQLQNSKISPLKALIKERHRLWNKEEEQQYKNQREESLGLMRERNASKKEIFISSVLTKKRFH